MDISGVPPIGKEKRPDAYAKAGAGLGEAANLMPWQIFKRSKETTYLSKGDKSNKKPLEAPKLPVADPLKKGPSTSSGQGGRYV